VVVVKDEVEVGQWKHTINQIEPINQSIALRTTNNKQAALSPDDHLILIPPSSPATAAILPAESLSGHCGLCTLLQIISSTFGGKSVASLERGQVKPR
jgi:hypothetical protein